MTSRDALARWDAGTLGIDWLAGKNAPTFLPVGPLLVPAKFVEDPQDLHIKLTVNGRTMQDESTADMLFDVAQLISYVSTVTELRPGDIVLTGSPAGNGASHGHLPAAGRPDGGHGDRARRPAQPLRRRDGRARERRGRSATRSPPTPARPSDGAPSRSRSASRRSKIARPSPT